MHVNCPHCHIGIEVVADATLGDMECESCGSNFSLVGDGVAETLNGDDRTITVGRFKLIQEVGKGAFGSVWKGKDPDLDRDIAIKIPRKGKLKPSEAEQFFREARAVAQLKHTNIVPVYEIGRDKDRIYIVSDFVEGLSVAERISIRPMGVRESVTLCAKVCDALHHAHENGIVHRDLKPSNIMLDDEGEPYVMDFGLAKRDAGEITMTVEGQILGTPAYMSPEQASGAGHAADRRTDIYSIGVMLFEFLSGVLPFRGNVRMLIHQVIHEEPPAVTKLNSNIDKDLATITAKCLEKDPDKRYLTAQELGNDLRSYLSGEPIKARPVSAVERGWRWCKRNRALSTSVGIAASLLLVLAVAGPIVAINQSSLRQDAEESLRIAGQESKRANEETKKALGAESQAKLSAKRAEDVLKIVTDSFKSANPLEGGSVEMTAKDVLDHAYGNLDESELDEIGKAKLLTSLSEAYWGLSDDKLSIETGSKSLEIQKELLGSNHKDTLFTMETLGTAYFKAGDYQKSLELRELALERQQLVLGLEHKDTLMTMNNLANTYNKLGRFQDALELREPAYKLLKKTLGEAHDCTLISMVNLSSAYNFFGRNEEAIELIEEAMKLRERVFGKEHARTLQAKGHLVDIYLSLGRHEEALRLSQQVLETSKKVLGPTHRDTLASMTRLASAFQVSNEIEKALQLSQETFELKRKNIGEKHLLTLLQAANLGWLHLQKGRELTKAEEFTTFARDELLIQFGPKNPNTVYSNAVLASVFTAQGEHEKAIQIFQNLLEIRKETLGPTHKDTLESMSQLSTAYESSNQIEKAIQLRNETLDLRRENQGDDNSKTLIEAGTLGWLYKRQGDLRKAQDLIEPSFKKLVELFGPEYYFAQFLEKELARIHSANGDHGSAIKIYETALRRMKASKTENLQRVMELKTNLAYELVFVKKFRKAIRLYEEILPWQKKEFGESHDNTIHSMLQLAICFQSTRKFADSLPVLEDLIRGQTKKLGPRHPDTIWSIGSKGFSHLQLDELIDSAKSYRQAAQLASEVYGSSGNETQNYENDFELVLARIGTKALDHLAAGEFSQAAISIQTIEPLHSSSKDVLIDNLQVLHLALLADREWENCLKVIEKWKTLINDRKNHDKKLLAWAGTSQSVCLLELGRDDEAKKIAESVLKNRSITPANRARAENVLALCLALDESHGEAIDLAVSSYNKLEKLIASAPPFLVWYLPRSAERVVKVFELAKQPLEVANWKNELEKAQTRVNKSEKLFLPVNGQKD